MEENVSTDGQEMNVILKYFDDFSETQLKQMAALKPLYSEWNEKINVISRKDIDQLYERHVLHALSVAAAFAITPGSKVLDLGTGGGFPGLPLAIFFPEVEFLLVDSIGKKLKVIEAIKTATGIQNIETRHTRAELIKDQKFDYVVSRAVAPLSDLWRWSKPLLKKTPRQPAPGLICLKGGDLRTEISESKLKPRMMEISELFDEPYFKEKYLVYVSV